MYHHLICSCVEAKDPVLSTLDLERWGPIDDDLIPVHRSVRNQMQASSRNLGLEAMNISVLQSLAPLRSTKLLRR